MQFQSIFCKLCQEPKYDDGGSGSWILKKKITMRSGEYMRSLQKDYYLFIVQFMRKCESVHPKKQDGEYGE